MIEQSQELDTEVIRTHPTHTPDVRRPEMHSPSFRVLCSLTCTRNHPQFKYSQSKLAFITCPLECLYTKVPIALRDLIWGWCGPSMVGSTPTPRQKHVLPFVFSATSLLTSRHQLSFFWLSREAWMFLSMRALWIISRNCGQNWQVLNISRVYRCMDLKWWMIPLVGLKISAGVLSRIFTAFRILLKYKARGRSCSAMVLSNTWRGGKENPTTLVWLWYDSYIPACRKPHRLILSLPWVAGKRS